MRTKLPLFAALLCSTAALAMTEASVNAAESRKPIAPSIYNGAFGDEMTQAQLGAAYGIGLPNGELARVALLGNFGQKGVTGVFSEAPLPPAPSPAVALYTDYDGHGGRFGDTSVLVASSNPNLSVFAAYDLDAKVTVVLLNKSATLSEPVVLGLKGVGQKGDWRAFEMSADGTIAPAGTGTLFDAQLTRTVAPYTALLVEFRPVAGILPVYTPAPVEVTLSAVKSVEAAPAAAPMGCAVTDVGFLSMSLLGMLGLVRRRPPGK
jgi:hypothetical protein